MKRTEKDAKAERLAAALRENLRKRKAQARGAPSAVEPAAMIDDAGFEEAMRILADPAQAALYPQAIAAIDAAAEAGHAAAAERRALLEARGSLRKSDWSAALDWLEKAASAGSEAAAGQLAILADGGRGPVEVAQKLRPPANAGRILSRDPLIHAIRGMASRAECDWLIRNARDRLDRAGIYGEGQAANAGRTNRAAKLDFVNADLISEMLRQRLANEIGAPVNHFEVAQVLHYRVGEQFVLHHDALNPATLGPDIARHGQRPMTLLVYLNDDFEGGATSFPQVGVEHRGETGDALIFVNTDRNRQPDMRMVHEGRPPSSGEKWVFSQWVRDRALN